MDSLGIGIINNSLDTYEAKAYLLESLHQQSIKYTLGTEFDAKIAV